MTLTMAELRSSPASYTGYHPEVGASSQVNGYSSLGSVQPSGRLMMFMPLDAEHTEGFQTALREIAQLAQLEPDWDSYGAGRFDDHLIQRAREFLVRLASHKVPPPTVIPAASGSILLEWSTDQLHLEIDFDPMEEDAVFIQYGTARAVEYFGKLFEMEEPYRRELNSALNYLT